MEKEDPGPDGDTFPRYILKDIVEVGIGYNREKVDNKGAWVSNWVFVEGVDPKVVLLEKVEVQVVVDDMGGSWVVAVKEGMAVVFLSRESVF